MRIEFLTQDDPLYILPFFDEFFRNYSSEFEILRISCCPTMGKRSRLQLLRDLAALYGVGGFIRLLSTIAKSRLLGKLPRSRSASKFYTLEQLARAFDIPFKKIGNPNANEFLDSIRQRAADVIVSVACPYILKEKLLSLPPRGCINIHHAPLPKYKGMMPTFWQMLHGEKTVGVTVHFMSAKVDEGGALLQEQLAIEPGEALDHLIRRSKRHGAHCMAQVLRQVATGTQQIHEISQGSGSYFTFPTLKEIHQFHRKGLRAI
jgi:methionyl-tRNA formyltransferase